MIGRPLKFKTAKELQTKIDNYFKTCDEHTIPYVTKSGELIQVPHAKPYTVTGLALALDTSRKVLLEYESKNEFSNTITRAKSRIEEYAETRLYDKDGCNGAKFNLSNNFGWKEKVENDMNIGNKDGQPFEIKQTVPDEEIEERLFSLGFIKNE